MSRLIIAVAAFATFAIAAHAEISHSSNAFAKRYTIKISDEILEKSPSWNDDAENPPLSARKAISLANEMKDSLVKDSDEFKWKLQSTSLQPTDGDKWYWLVRYEAKFQGGGSTGVPNHLRLAVLMDGTVIKPIVSDYP